MCIRQSGPLNVGDTLLEPTTEDEIGERLNGVALVEASADGRLYLRVLEPLGMQHSEESTVSVPIGLYRMRADRNWPGAALVGLCVEV